MTSEQFWREEWWPDDKFFGSNKYNTLEFAEAYAASQVRDLTRPIDGTFVLSAEPTKEEISQARQVIGQLQREVRDLTNSHSEKVVRKLNADVEQFRADCIRLSAEVRDLTGERDNAIDHQRSETRRADESHERNNAYLTEIRGLRATVEGLERELAETKS